MEGECCCTGHLDMVTRSKLLLLKRPKKKGAIPCAAISFGADLSLWFRFQEKSFFLAERLVASLVTHTTFNPKNPGPFSNTSGLGTAHTKNSAG